MADTSLPKQSDSSIPGSTKEGGLPAPRYDDALRILHEEALKRNEVWKFADVLIWHLAHIASANTAVFGEVLSRLGGNTRQVTQQYWAEAEAQRIKKDGPPHH